MLVSLKRCDFNLLYSNNDMDVDQRRLIYLFIKRAQFSHTFILFKRAFIHDGSSTNPEDIYKVKKAQIIILLIYKSRTCKSLSLTLITFLFIQWHSLHE